MALRKVEMKVLMTADEMVDLKGLLMELLRGLYLAVLRVLMMVDTMVVLKAVLWVG